MQHTTFLLFLQVFVISYPFSEQLKSKLQQKLSSSATILSRKSLPTSPHKRPSSKKKTYTATSQASESFSPSKPTKPLFMDGIQFPTSLDSHHAVNKVLCQQRGKMKASQLRQVASSLGQRDTSSGPEETSRQLKEAMFMSRVKEAADAERANKPRWSVVVVYIR